MDQVPATILVEISCAVCQGTAGLRRGLIKLTPERRYVIQVDIITPEEYMGDVIGDINSRRGSIVELSDRMGMKSVESLVPLANMFQV